MLLLRGKKMSRLLPALAIAVAAALTLPFAAHAADATGKWSGSGEFGFAASRGNTHSENLNAKLALDYQDDTWKDDFFLNMLRAKGEVKTPVVVDGVTTGYASSFDTTANRIEVGASSGYKFNPRSYVVGALRYDHDDFAANRWEQVASLGFGYMVLKDASSELSFEIGPGYKRSQPKSFRVVNTATVPPTVTTVNPAVETQAIGRSLVNFKHRITDNTRFEDTLLAESGTQNTFYQNEAGLAVSMTKTLALKLGYETRYNSEIAPGAEHSDQLFTTNLVYSFSGSK
jgi:putative salt-induced outer membrane protein